MCEEEREREKKENVPKRLGKNKKIVIYFILFYFWFLPFFAFRLRENYDRTEKLSVSKRSVYKHYEDECMHNNVTPMSHTFFGKLVRRAFPNIKCNRKGPRGLAQQHYRLARKDATKPGEADQVTSVPSSVSTPIVTNLPVSAVSPTPQKGASRQKLSSKKKVPQRGKEEAGFSKQAVKQDAEDVDASALSCLFQNPRMAPEITDHAHNIRWDDNIALSSPELSPESSPEMPSSLAPTAYSSSSPENIIAQAEQSEPYPPEEEVLSFPQDFLQGFIQDYPPWTNEGHVDLGHHGHIPAESHQEYGLVYHHQHHHEDSSAYFHFNQGPVHHYGAPVAMTTMNYDQQQFQQQQVLPMGVAPSLNYINLLHGDDDDYWHFTSAGMEESTSLSRAGHHPQHQHQSHVMAPSAHAGHQHQLARHIDDSSFLSMMFDAPGWKDELMSDPHTYSSWLTDMAAQ